MAFCTSFDEPVGGAVVGRGVANWWSRDVDPGAFFAEATSVMPVAGGIARLPHFTHGDVTSSVLGWSAWVGYNTSAPIETIAMLEYLD